MQTRRLTLLAAFLLLGLAAGPQTRPTSFDFEKTAVGQLPQDFATALTGKGGAGEWKVVEDDTAPAGNRVLAQLSKDDTDYRFPVCVYEGLTAKDAEVSVRFKAVSGTVDRAAGVMLRYRDKDNYYVVRANALENNVRLYKLENGHRTQLAGANTKVSELKWHTLQVDLRGSHFVVHYDEQKLFEADDATFKEAGKVGLWTKADSVTYFDSLSILPTDEHP